MTQIRPLAQPVNRRPGELGVHSLDRFNFSVPDVEQARKFYSSFGLDVREERNALHIHTHGHSHRWGSVIEGPKKKLQFISFGAFEDDLPRFRERLDALRIERIDPPPGVESNGIWFRDPDGTPIEIRVAEKSSPNEKSSTENISCAARRRGRAELQHQAVRAAAADGAHAGLHPRHPGDDQVLQRGAGAAAVGPLRRHDRLHARHPRQRSSHDRVREGGWARPASPELGRALDQSRSGSAPCRWRTRAYVAGWGLGRHVLGSNYFHYVRDPWGSYAEYSSDIDYIPVDQDWKSGDHPPEDSFYVWGPTPPADFAFNHEFAVVQK